MSYELSELTQTVIYYIGKDQLSVFKAVQKTLKNSGRKRNRKNIALLTDMVKDQLEADDALTEINWRSPDIQFDAFLNARQRHDEMLPKDA